MLIHCKRKSDAIFDGGVVGGGYFSGDTLFVKDNIVTCTYNAFDENYYRINRTCCITVPQALSLARPLDHAGKPRRRAALQRRKQCWSKTQRGAME